MAYLKHVIAIMIMTALANLAVDARAQAPDAAELSQVERARAAVANELHLMAAELLDELVFEWSLHPPLAQPAAVALIGLDVPIGFNRQLVAFLENHFYSLVSRHRNAQITIVHCSACLKLTAVAAPESTIIARGVETSTDSTTASSSDPDQQMLSQASHALFLDFEAEGAELVLRARITTIGTPREIVYGRTLALSSSSAPMLRDPSRLVTVADARADFVRILRSEPLYSFPLMVNLRIYPLGNVAEGQTVIPPMPWFEGGFAVYFNRKRLWRGSFMLGSSSVQDSHDAWSLGGSIGRLISSGAYSLTQPNLYISLGSSYIEISGPTASSFLDPERPSASVIANDQEDSPIKKQPRASLAVMTLSFDAFISQFLMARLAVEYIPSLDESKSHPKEHGFVHNYVFGVGINL